MIKNKPILVSTFAVGLMLWGIWTGYQHQVSIQKVDRLPQSTPNAPTGAQGLLSKSLVPPRTSVPPQSMKSGVKSKDSKKDIFEWSDFADKFGSSLKPQFNAHGQLITIHGAPGQGTPADDFAVKDDQKVLLRSKEIINAVEGLLKLNSSLPLGKPIWKSGPVTAQIFYKETYQGLDLHPGGNLKIDLGPKGEILGLFSDYMPELKVDSTIHISSSDALKKVLISQSGQLNPTRDINSKGNKVVWITEATRGRIAYQFFIGGREVIVDAGSGEILSSRDRRQN